MKLALVGLLLLLMLGVRGEIESFEYGYRFGRLFFFVNVHFLQCFYLLFFLLVLQLFVKCCRYYAEGVDNIEFIRSSVVVGSFKFHSIDHKLLLIVDAIDVFSFFHKSSVVLIN